MADEGGTTGIGAAQGEPGFVDSVDLDALLDEIEGSPEAEQTAQDEATAAMQAEESERKAKEREEWKRWAESTDDEGEESEEEEEGETRKPAARTKPDDTPKRPESYTVRLGEQDRDIRFDRMARSLGIPEEQLEALPEDLVKRVYQREWLANQRQREGTESFQVADRFFQGLKGNPSAAIDEVLQRAGVGKTFAQLAQEYYAAEFELAKLPEAQREERRAQMRLERLRAEEQHVIRQRQQEEQQSRQQRWMREFRESTTESLRASGLEPHPRFQIRMLDILNRSRQSGDDLAGDPTPKELVKALRDEFREDFRSFTKGMKVEQLAELVGEENVKAIREAAVKRFKQQTRRAPESPAREPREPRNRTPKPAEDHGPMTYTEMARKM